MSSLMGFEMRALCIHLVAVWERTSMRPFLVVTVIVYWIDTGNRTGSAGNRTRTGHGGSIIFKVASLNFLALFGGSRGSGSGDYCSRS